ncbi:MAG: cbb3-type cytochrome oxidase assembly protein CcoS [Bacteroidetes bacterium]|nr:MAG: cbb3-type cytochrome oxidase assembly protein CcoS [Bacteroidota bacterium]
MNIMILLIGASLFIALIFLGAFIWAVRSGQYDDDYTPSMRILLDDTDATSSDIETKQSN